MIEYFKILFNKKVQKKRVKNDGKRKLISILDNLKKEFSLSLYNFEKETAIIKDIALNKMFKCDVLFNENKPFFINIVEKEVDYLIANDLN